MQALSENRILIVVRHIADSIIETRKFPVKRENRRYGIGTYTRDVSQKFSRNESESEDSLQ